MKKIIIGRDQNCNFVIDDNSVSRNHAEILVKEGAVILKDLDSSNGTFMWVHNNKSKIKINSVAEHDQVYFGDSGPHEIQEIIRTASVKSDIQNAPALELEKQDPTDESLFFGPKGKLRCPDCGAIIEKKHKHCPECGTSI